MRRLTSSQALVFLLVLLVALLFFMFPVVWMFLTSFKSGAEYFSYPPVFWPKSFSLRNYFNAMAFPPDGRGGLQGLRDSLAIAAGSTLASVVIGSLAAYSLSRFKTGGENLSFWILSTRMFPPVAAALPLFLIFKQLRLLDNHLALVIANTIFNLPFVQSCQIHMVKPLSSSFGLFTRFTHLMGDTCVWWFVSGSGGKNG